MNFSTVWFLLVILVYLIQVALSLSLLQSPSMHEVDHRCHDTRHMLYHVGKVIFALVRSDVVSVLRPCRLEVHQQLPFFSHSKVELRDYVVYSPVLSLSGTPFVHRT